MRNFRYFTYELNVDFGYLMNNQTQNYFKLLKKMSNNVDYKLNISISNNFFKFTPRNFFDIFALNIQETFLHLDLYNFQALLLNQSLLIDFLPTKSAVERVLHLRIGYYFDNFDIDFYMNRLIELLKQVGNI